jgi:hypothetical protein
MKLLIISIAMAAVISFAHVPLYMAYHGQLAGPNGLPVPDSTYTIMFSIWHNRTGGQAVWTESHAVETQGGMFTVYLGSVNPLNAEAFTVTSMDSAFLQVQVFGDAPMFPRAILGTSPTSIFTSRISGDIFTEPGRLTVRSDAPIFPGEVRAFAEGSTADLQLKICDTDIPRLGLHADSTGGAFSIRDGTSLLGAEMRAEPDGIGFSFRHDSENLMFPDITLRGDGTGGIFSLADPRPTPVFQDFEINNGVNGIVLSLNGPEQFPTIPGLILSADAEGPRILFGLPETQMVSVGAFEDGGYFELFDGATGNLAVSIHSGGLSLFDDGAHGDGIILHNDLGAATMVLDADGDIDAIRANFGNDNDNTGTTSFVAGTGNTVSGNYATIPGGRGNGASGDYSFAAGRYAQANHSGAFVWADASGMTLPSTADNQFKCRASGGTYFYSNLTNTRGVWLPSSGYQWQSLMGRDQMTDIRTIDDKEILQKLRQLPIHRWRSREENSDVQHIGPIAEDFNGIFGVGVDQRYISALDPSGVALAGLKGLLHEVEVLKQRNAELERRIIELEQAGRY